MSYKIVKSKNEELLIKDMEERLDKETCFEEGYKKEIMFVPVGIISKDGKIACILSYNNKLL